MKPISLTIEGINSFCEPQTVDFETLCKEKIFGIFGNTGSGKSTILDSMMFALYGRMDRGNVNNDFINKRTDTARADIVFDMTDGGKVTRYEIDRTLKQSKDKTRVTPQAKMYKIENGLKIPIADRPETVNSAVVGVLGIDFDIFKKCIALPQGQFAQFLNETGKERTQTMDKIFDLNKFGNKLWNKIKRKKDRLGQSKLCAETNLNSFKDLTESAQKEKEAKKSKLVSDLEAEDGLRKNYSALVSDMQKEKDRLDKLLKVNTEINTLNFRDDEIKNSERKVLLASKAQYAISEYNRFCDALKSKNDSETQRALCKKNFEDFNADFEKFEKEHTENRTKFADLKEKSVAKKAKLESIEADCKLLEKLKADITDLRFKCKEQAKKVQAGHDACVGFENKFKDTALCLEQAQKNYDISDQKIKDYYRFLGIDAKNEAYGEWLVNVKNLKAETESRTKDIQNLSESTEIKFARTDEVKIYSEKLESQKTLVEEKIKKSQDTIFWQGFDLAAAENSEKVLKDECDKLIKEKDEFQKSFNEAQITLEKDYSLLTNINGQGLKTKADLEALNQKVIQLIPDGSTYEIEIKAVSKEIDDAKKSEAELEEKYNFKTAELAKFKEKSEAADAQFEKDAQNLTSSEAEFKAVILKQGFKDENAFKDSIMSADDIESAQKEIEEYKNRLISLGAQKTQLENSALSLKLDVSKLPSVKDELESSEKKCVDLNRQIAVLDAEIKNDSENILKKKEYEKQIADTEKEIDIVNSIADIVGKTSLMEYVAEGYIDDITFNASQRLSSLTDGKYELVYKENTDKSGFYVTDNLNAGEVRPASTLSGGEIFITSLALAIAMSEIIVLNSSKPLEFFFLDEGFGSLDTEKLDDVVEYLEKLRNTHFTIGFISHVEGLKNRIYNKLEVEAANDEHGSVIKLLR